MDDLETMVEKATEQRRKDIEYLAANLGHELTLGLKALMEQQPGLWQPVDHSAALYTLAAALQELAAALRERR